MDLQIEVLPLARSVLDFFWNNFPAFSLIGWLFPLTVLWSFGSLYAAGYCKRQCNWKTGYTRKLFHFLIFFTAFLYQRKFGLPGVFILGWAVTLLLSYAIFKGNGNILYEALAREKDAPHETKYIIYSYLATFFGGVLSNLLFGPFAVFGYAVTGIADAVAEPIGTRFGRHHYRVFSIDKHKKSFRSLEGSMAVFISVLAIIYLSPCLYFLPLSNYLWIAIVCTLVEALSPSGFDNMLLQLVASLLFHHLLYNSVGYAECLGI